MEALAVAIRFGLYFVLALSFGVAAFALHALRGGERRSGAVLPLTPIALTAALAGVLLSGLGLLATTAALAGSALMPVDRATLDILLHETPLGIACFVRLVALAVSVAGGILLRRVPAAAAAAAALGGGVALATLAWSGHGAMDEGAIGALHLAIDIAHLLAAGLWVGALAGFVLLLFRRPGDAGRLPLLRRALAGFAVTGTFAVAVLIATGIGNAWLILGLDGVVALPSTLYGRLLIAKLLLFGVMLLLAATNRFRLTPAFERALAAGEDCGALAVLRRSIAAEALAGIAILALVAWLGTLDPMSGL